MNWLHYECGIHFLSTVTYPFFVTVNIPDKSPTFTNILYIMRKSIPPIQQFSTLISFSGKQTQQFRGNHI